MCEIVRSNFENKYSEITSAIDRAVFIGIDTELTGINIGKGSLFDTAEERYKILKDSASKFFMCQIGLSMFIPFHEENRYEVATYNFYLFPLAQGITDFQFSCLGSCIEFLCDYKFDFNKFFYEGVPYMNKIKEAELRSEINDQSSFSCIYRNQDERKLQEVLQFVLQWLLSAQEGDTTEIEQTCQLSPYIIHFELLKRFPNVWMYNMDDNKKIIVEKISPSVRKEREEKDDCIDKLLKSFLGFSRIFQYLVEKKKPILGHNCLFDLLMIYHHFHKPLPEKLAAFKKEIHSLFPVIYDTKHIALSMSKELEKHNLSSASSLQELYKTFSCEKGRFCVLYSPTITFETNMRNYLSGDFFHEAGYDSYMAGYVFLRLAHFHANKNTNVSYKTIQMRPLSPFEHMQSLSQYMNHVNVIRAQINYINLNGNDPAVKRPPWLVLQSKKRVPLNLSEVTSLMSQFGNIDLQLRNQYEAFVAVGNFHCEKEIIRGFLDHDAYEISKYNVFRHSTVIRSLAWLVAIASGSLGTYLLYHLLQQPKKPS